jgi:hypothetical protein
VRRWTTFSMISTDSSMRNSLSILRLLLPPEGLAAHIECFEVGTSVPSQGLNWGKDQEVCLNDS